MKEVYVIKIDEVLSFVSSYVKDKSVLDVGCVEHDVKNIHKGRIWVHDYLKSVANDVIGLDYLKKSVDELNKRGYKIVCQNAENIKLDKKFDVVFAGEIIEHLSNPGLFLESVKKCLNKNSLLIITTPNAFSINRLVRILFLKTNNPECNSEHVLYHSPQTLDQLLSRHNFKIRQFSYGHYPNKNPSIKNKIVYFLCSIFGKKFKETMMVICQMNEN